MGIAIKVENLSKKYVINRQKGPGYLTLRDVLQRKLKGLFSPVAGGGASGTRKEDFYALKNVSFDVKPGDRLGIIGRNGAGKSTLLKILSRITEPTSGKLSMNGRVASLLEVGTGFHPELTGRENIYLNGAILGMTRAEIRRKFDEIVAFAEVEKFLDTPVKYYSSGMYVRLAFAVAAHLEPEILVVDEVLAVGDAQFQKKCMAKMGSVSKEGRTILFVSHNIGAIRKLCNKALLLNKGQISAQGEAAQVVETYLGELQNTNADIDLAPVIAKLPPDPAFRLNSIVVQKHDASKGMRFLSDREIVINFDYEVLEAHSKLFINLEIADSDGEVLVETFNNADDPNPVPAGSYSTKAVIPAGFLCPRLYEMRIYAGIFGGRDFLRPAITFPFEVSHEGQSNMAYGLRHLGGKVVLPVKWQNERKA